MRQILVDRYGLQQILIGLLVLSIGRKLKPPAGVHHKRNYFDQNTGQI